MKPSFFSCVFALLVAASLPLTASAMSNKDLLKMQKAGLSEETILTSMQKEKADYDTGTDALIELKTAGVSEKVIQKMIKLQSGDASASEAPAASSGSAPNPVFAQNFPSIAPPTIEPVAGKDYFTRYTFHEEKGEYSTTNYTRGAVVPINTKVNLVSLSGDKMVLKRLDTGEKLVVKNEEKYTQKPIAGIASQMLAAEETALNKLPEEVATALRSGEMRKGMTKELVLMARGYPPAHETPSVDGDRWVYWSSRFIKLTVIFSNGRLSDGRGIY